MKESKVPKYFARAHTICLLVICAVNSFDFFFGPFKNDDACKVMNYFQVFCWLFILPAMFIATIVILLIYRKNILSNMLAMLFNIITWLFVVAAFAVKF